MPPTSHDRAAVLPDGWTFHLRTTLNVTVLTLRDSNGEDREIGYHRAPVLDAPELTVHTLEEIPDEELRTAARELTDVYRARYATARANTEAFSAAVPDFSDLTGRLRRAVPGCRIDTGLDHTALTLTVTLAADGPPAGRLLTLIASWTPPPTADGAPGASDRELTESGTLTVRLTQDQARAFLTWYRDQPGFEVDFDADSVYLRDGAQPLGQWCEAEWKDNPRLVIGIVHAVDIGHTQGADALRAALAQQPRPDWPPLP